MQERGVRPATCDGRPAQTVSCPESCVEHVLLKLARQLDALDEASLVALWDKYSAQAAKFEPSKRWEESVLVLSLIQAKRWKNQLFNQQWAARSRPEDVRAPKVPFSLETPSRNTPHEGKPRAKVLAFRPQSEAGADDAATQDADSPDEFV